MLRGVAFTGKDIAVFQILGNFVVVSFVMMALTFRRSVMHAKLCNFQSHLSTLQFIILLPIRV